MLFFELTHPEYATDRERDLKNSVVASWRYLVPGLNCEVCGPWSGSDRLRVALPQEMQEFEKVRFLPMAEWMQHRHEWSRHLGIAVDDLRPGAELGPPIGKCSSAIREDFVHPIPGQIWVNGRVQEALSTAHLVGVSFADVQMSGECGGVKLAELVVHGRAWRKRTPLGGDTLCDICGRRGFPSPGDLAVDEMRWDRSDVFILDNNPNIIVVTDRVAQLINAHGFSNVLLEPIRSGEAGLTKV